MTDSALSQEVRSLASDASQFIDRTTAAAGATAHRSLDAVVEGSDKLQSKVRHVGDFASDYIRHEPLKSVLMAAAAGAMLTALIGMLTRSRS